MHQYRIFKAGTILAICLCSLPLYAADKDKEHTLPSRQIDMRTGKVKQFSPIQKNAITLRQKKRKVSTLRKTVHFGNGTQSANPNTQRLQKLFNANRQDANILRNLKDMKKFGETQQGYGQTALDKRRSQLIRPGQANLQSTAGSLSGQHGNPFGDPLTPKLTRD
jgi:hypothetical protein